MRLAFFYVVNHQMIYLCPEWSKGVCLTLSACETHLYTFVAFRCWSPDYLPSQALLQARQTLALVGPVPDDTDVGLERTCLFSKKMLVSC